MRIEIEPEALATECHWVNTQTRNCAFAASDMEYQLSQLTIQEVTLKQELTSIGETINISTLDNWEETVVELLDDLKTGFDELKELKAVASQTTEEQHEVFTLMKRVLVTLVERIEIDKD